MPLGLGPYLPNAPNASLNFPKKLKCHLQKLILKHLATLSDSFKHYFPSINTSGVEWVLIAIKNAEALTNIQRDQLADLSSDTTLKLKFQESQMESFWIYVYNEYQRSAVKPWMCYCHFQLHIYANLHFQH